MAVFIEPVAFSIRPHGFKSGIQKIYFPPAASRWVPGHNRIQFSFQFIKHKRRSLPFSLVLAAKAENNAAKNKKPPHAVNRHTEAVFPRFHSELITLKAHNGATRARILRRNLRRFPRPAWVIPQRRCISPLNLKPGRFQPRTFMAPLLWRPVLFKDTSPTHSLSFLFIQYTPFLFLVKAFSGSFPKNIPVVAQVYKARQHGEKGRNCQ